MAKSQRVPHAVAPERPLSGVALKAQQAKASKSAGPREPVHAHERVVLTSDFETHQGGSRIFKAGTRSLPKHLAAEARAKGLVAPAEAE